MKRPFSRATRNLPYMVGLSPLLDFYRRHLPPDSFYRISDFDGDLLLEVTPAETIGVNLWHAPNIYEKAERKLFCSALKPSSTVLDIGANIGIYTLLAAKRGAQVFAIEADPENARMLRQNVKLNGFGGRVTVYEIAASDSERMLALYRNPANSGGTSIRNNGLPSFKVPACTIDSLQLPSLDICKMDIEGAERSALVGMHNTVARSPNMKLLIEYNQLSDSTALLALLRKTFKNISVSGKRELAAHEIPPVDCHLWCSCPATSAPTNTESP
jgi:FkbM family methyltransferase